MGDIKKQLPDGRWIDAQPLPYIKDTRPWYVKVWHIFIALCWFLEGIDDDEFERRLDNLTKKWQVPVEPSYKERIQGDCNET